MCLAVYPMCRPPWAKLSVEPLSPLTSGIRVWPAPGSEETELGVLMELEVSHGETEVYTGIQA
jgi:hypothetical protein